MNVVFSNALSRRFLDGALTSAAVHPGFVVSGLDRTLPPAVERVMGLIRCAMGRTTASGAVTQVTVATSPALDPPPEGAYYEDRCISGGCRACLFCRADGRSGVRPAAAATDRETQDWLWNTS